MFEYMESPKFNDVFVKSS